MPEGRGRLHLERMPRFSRVGGLHEALGPGLAEAWEAGHGGRFPLDSLRISVLHSNETGEPLTTGTGGSRRCLLDSRVRDQRTTMPVQDIKVTEPVNVLSIFESHRAFPATCPEEAATTTARRAPSRAALHHFSLVLPSYASVALRGAAMRASSVESAQAEIWTIRQITVSMRLHGILRCVRGLRLSYMFWLWRQTAERHHPRAQVVELAREVAMLRTHCSSRDETIKELSAQFAEARQAADSLSASLDKERTTLEARLSYRQEEVLELRSQLQRASVDMRSLSAHLTHVRVIILRQLLEHCSRESLRVAVRTWSAAMRSASGGLTQSQLAQDHLELTHQFHLLKRRLDAALADKGRLQASAAARDRELQQEASALRSALLAAGASHQERVGGAGIQSRNPAVSSLSTSMAGKDGRLDLPTVHDDERNRKVISPPSSVRRGHNLPPEAMAEVLTLRRKLQAVHADNALLTQNFMMVKTRLSDVSAQREADHNSMQAVHARLEASMDLQLGQLARAHRSILRSELTTVDWEVKQMARQRRQHLIEQVLTSAALGLLFKGMFKWTRLLCTTLRNTIRSSVSQGQQMQRDSLGFKGSRLVRIKEMDSGLWRTIGTARAFMKWRLLIQLFFLEEAQQASDQLRWEIERLRSSLRENESEIAEKIGKVTRTEAAVTQLQRIVAQHQETAHTSALQVAASQRERDSMAARLADSEMQQQLLRTHIDAASEERRRFETSRMQLEREIDELKRELKQAQSGLHQVQLHSVDKSSSLQQHSYQLATDLHQLRARLQDVEKQRERERNGLVQYKALVAQLQGQLALQRATAAQHFKDHLKTHISRSQADAELAFSVDLLTFANKF